MKYRFSILILAILALAGCKKDNLADIPEGAILLTTESHSGTPGTKTSVKDLSIQWVVGDRVNLAGQDYSVVFNGQTAYVENFVRPANDYFSYYPAGLTASLTASETSVTVPSSYVSSYDNGWQVLKQPLVALTPYNASSIQFLYVTSSVQVLVKNTTGHDLIIDRVEVSSADKQLCGDCTISFNFNVTDLTVTPKTSGITADEKKVVVTFEGAPLVVTSGGDPVEVQVPILPVGEGNLTVAIYTHVPGATPFSGYRFSRTLSNPAIARNQMMTARVLFNNSSQPTGLWFSVSETTKVIFSQGNLQYQASSQTWRFAEHQYDRIGDDNANISSNYSGWIDLFGWGTGGNPTLSTTVANNYANFTDWGTNAISNGGNDADYGWRTLTSEEWKYLLTQRNASTVSGVANARYAIARVYEQNGLIIFPDVYEHPVNVDLQLFINQTNIVWTSLVQINSDNWRMMEAAGAVFLPAAGYRGYENGSLTIFNVDNEGDYWSSTVGSGTARRVMFSNSNTGDFATSNGVNPYLGYSVRLVKNAN